MPQKPSFRGKRSPRKQSSSQTHCQPCKPSCLENLTQCKRSSQRTSAPSPTTCVVLQRIPAHTGIRGNEIDQLTKEGREKEQPPSHLSYREVKTLIHNNKKAIFHCKTRGYNPHQDTLPSAAMTPTDHHLSLQNNPLQTVCGTHRREDLVNATITLSAKEEEEEEEEQDTFCVTC